MPYGTRVGRLREAIDEGCAPTERKPAGSEPDGGDSLVIASLGGPPQNPVWFRNLVATPEAVIEVDDKKLDVRVTVTSGDEQARLWKKIVASGPFFENEYQAKTTREIPWCD